jgi:hypothetical protein
MECGKVKALKFKVWRSEFKVSLHGEFKLMPHVLFFALSLPDDQAGFCLSSTK